ncbi:MAG: deoxyribose-phosphate aldolase [Bacilli bacterium]|jgi:deoxyribose-phosphate aldolase
MKVNKLIDHTLLKAFATNEDINKLCEEAKKYQFMSVCVNPYFVPLAKELLKDSEVLVCTVVGFPLGANTMETKWNETINAIDNGADEIDMVINVSKAKEHDWEYIRHEIAGVVAAASGKLVKVIIETCYLTDDEKIEAAKMAVLAGAKFVKTSTGFGTGGATVHDVKLIRENVPAETGVKASGGIKSFDDLSALVNAGANRIGASSGVFIMNNLKSEEDY